MLVIDDTGAQIAAPCSDLCRIVGRGLGFRIRNLCLGFSDRSLQHSALAPVRNERTVLRTARHKKPLRQIVDFYASRHPK